MSKPKATTSSRAAARTLNELSYIFCEEDNAAYDEVLETYFLSAGSDSESENDSEVEGESSHDCKY